MDTTPTAISRWRGRWFFCASYMLVGGLAIVYFSGVYLLAARSPHSPFLQALRPVGLLFLIWLFCGMVLTLEIGPHPSKEDAFIFLMAVCFGLVIGFVKLPWAILLAGLLAAVLYLGLGRIRLRAYYAAATGWFLAGLAVPRYIAWPDDQQYAFFCFLGGVATTFEGSRELIWYLRFRHPRSASE